MQIAKEQFIARAKECSAYEQTVCYLRDRLSTFLRPQERVLLCFPEMGPYTMGAMVSRALDMLGGSPVLWGPDHSWQSLLRQAFFSRATAIVGPPLIVLGLAKVARATMTPLSIRNVLLAGAPCEDWMIGGIQSGLDCRLWGCFDPVPGVAVGGFSCAKSRGVHIREDALSVMIADEKGAQLPSGQKGRILLRHAGDSGTWYDTGSMAYLEEAPCACGSSAPRLMDFSAAKEPDPALDGLTEHLLSWTSVLDYRAKRTEMGLELEVVAFPGERLPVLPECARRVVRPWVAKHDVPFCIIGG